MNELSRKPGLKRALIGGAIGLLLGLFILAVLIIPQLSYLSAYGTDESQELFVLLASVLGLPLTSASWLLFPNFNVPLPALLLVLNWIAIGTLVGYLYHVLATRVFARLLVRQIAIGGIIGLFMGMMILNTLAVIALDSKTSNNFQEIQDFFRLFATVLGFPLAWVGTVLWPSPSSLIMASFIPLNWIMFGMIGGYVWHLRTAS